MKLPQDCWSKPIVIYLAQESSLRLDRAVCYVGEGSSAEIHFQDGAHRAGRAMLAVLLLHVGRSTGWHGLPYSMVAVCQEQSIPRESNGSCQLLKA